MRAITEKTFIPISMIGAIIGGAVWLTTIYNTSAANAANIKDLKYQRNSLLLELRIMNSRLSRIEGALGVVTPVKNP